MSKLSKFLIATAVAAIILPTGAMAAAVTGSSSGTLSFPAGNNGCDHSGSSQDCRIINSSTELQWGSTSQFTDFVNPSTLTADALAIGSFSTAQTNVKVGELTWFNSSTRSDSTPSDFTFNYALTVTFSSPVGGTGDSQTFNLDITNTSNPLGDVMGGFTNSDLAALSFSLPGWTVTNFHYAIDDATVGNGSPTFGGSCGTGNWCNTESNTSDLFIEADFTPNATSVPEPMTLSLFGAGLVGAVGFGMRRRKKA